MNNLRPNMVSLLIEADAQFWGNHAQVQIQECISWCTFNAIIEERLKDDNGVSATLLKIFREKLGDGRAQRVYWLTFTDLNDDSIIAHLRIKA